MIYHTPTTPRSTGKAHVPSHAVSPNRATVTPFMLGFDALLIAIRRFVIAVDDCDHNATWDIALGAWAEDAEEARQHLDERVLSMRTLPVAGLGDQILKNMFLVLDMMLSASSFTVMLQANDRIKAHPLFFNGGQRSLTTERVNALLMRGRTLIDALVTAHLNSEAQTLLELPPDEVDEPNSDDLFDYFEAA